MFNITQDATGKKTLERVPSCRSVRTKMSWVKTESYSRQFNIKFYENHSGTIINVAMATKQHTLGVISGQLMFEWTVIILIIQHCYIIS
mgnify:CR=1 FL=1